MKVKDFSVECISPANIPNPIAIDPTHGYITDLDRVLYEPTLERVRTALQNSIEPASFELSGPRQKIAYNPAETKACIVTCGGICPGLNAVIRGLVLQLWHRYGVRNIVGARFGYQGLGADALPFVRLEPQTVVDIHEQGGSVLGSSRGSPSVSTMVDTLVANQVQILFTIGGDGTMRGAMALCDEIKRRGLKIAIIGVPKTIDNDIPYVRRSFGFETAVAIASQAISAAHNEARSVLNGVGLVKLMGRYSGYVAATTTIATGNVNICLVPEVPFSIEGENGLLAQIERRFEIAGHCVIVVAEGAGQAYFQNKAAEFDSSGNARLGDIGTLLRDRIGSHFKALNRNVPVRYIDPSYQIRAAAANPGDILFCSQLAQNAVHAAMTGRTAMLIGNWHGFLTHVPMRSLEGEHRAIDPAGNLWFTVLESTGQAATMS